MALANLGSPSSAAAGPYIAVFQFVNAVAGVLGPVWLSRIAQKSGLAAASRAAAAISAVCSAWWAFALPRNDKVEADEAPRDDAEEEGHLQGGGEVELSEQPKRTLS
jgi:hypothetical protein